MHRLKRAKCPHCDVGRAGETLYQSLQYVCDCCKEKWVASTGYPGSTAFYGAITPMGQYISSGPTNSIHPWELWAPYEPDEPELIPDVTIGWRIWRAKCTGTPEIKGCINDWQLHSWFNHTSTGLHSGEVWPAGDEYIAKCLCGDPNPYTDECGVFHNQLPVLNACGLYAARDYEHVRSQYGESFALNDKELLEYAFVIVGTVKLWGRVIHCERGYQAEKGYPDRLWVLLPESPSEFHYENMERCRADLERRYKVPCTIVNQRELEDQLSIEQPVEVSSEGYTLQARQQMMMKQMGHALRYGMAAYITVPQGQTSIAPAVLDEGDLRVLLTMDPRLEVHPGDLAAKIGLLDGVSNPEIIRAHPSIALTPHSVQDPITGVWVDTVAGTWRQWWM